MEFDRSLLDKEGAPTEEEMREYFIKNDYTMAKSDFDVSKVSPAQAKLYMKAKGFFLDAWLKQQKKMGGKGSLKNFSNDHPLKLMEQKDEELIVGTVGKILGDEEQTALVIGSFFDQTQPQFMLAFNAYAASVNKNVDDLTDDEIKMVVDKVADAFLETMMELFMKSQGIPAVIGITSDVHNQTHQDFPEAENFDKIDFQRAFYHTRTEIDTILSLDEFQENDYDAWESAKSFFDQTNDEFDPVAEDKKEQLIWNAYYQVLDNVEREILELRVKKFTNGDIAKQLGYKTQSAISKRLAKMRKKFDELIKEISEQLD